MLGDSAVLGTAVGGAGGGGGSSAAGEDAPAAAASAASPPAVAAGGGGTDGADVAAGGGGGSNSGDDYEKGERSFGGNRWPRQETLALLKIRSDMDVAFRDASLKGPLWEEVSRKLAELGYHRNAKKCKEKFENVYKYHKRTKEGRSGKSEGKTYRFFDQLEALENNPAAIHSPRPTTVQVAAALSATPVSMVKTTASLSLPLPPPPMPQQVSTNTATTTNAAPLSISTVPSTTMPQGSSILNIPTINPTFFQTPPPPSNFPSIPTGFLSNSTSTSSSTSSDETIEGARRRKRKWKDFFERLMKEVIEKQEELQRRFLEAIEKREQERAAREEAWRVQELQRINKEREILAQERSIAAAKDQAVMSFLQKIAEQQSITNIPQTTPTPTVQQQQQDAHAVAAAAAAITTTAAEPVVVAPVVAPPQQPQQVVTGVEIVKADDHDNNNNGENMAAGVSSSRWPKAEVQALINLRTSLEAKYNESGPKGPLWEEISSLMKKNGYNRNAKRCKEKWENINKYFKKVKESNKKRPEDSKTCPYFHQLEALYREKNKDGGGATVAPLMVRPEQQWPPQQAVVQPPEVVMEDARRQQQEQQHHEGEDEEEDDDDEEVKDMDEDEDDDDDDDDEGGGNNYEIVASKPVASSSAAAAAE